MLENIRAKEQSFLLLAWLPTMFAVCQRRCELQYTGSSLHTGANEGKNNPRNSLFSVTEQVLFSTPLIPPTTWYVKMTGVMFKLFVHPFPAIILVKQIHTYMYILHICIYRKIYIHTLKHIHVMLLYVASSSAVCLRKAGQSSGQTEGEGRESRLISGRGETVLASNAAQSFWRWRISESREHWALLI